LNATATRPNGQEPRSLDQRPKIWPGDDTPETKAENLVKYRDRPDLIWSDRDLSPHLPEGWRTVRNELRKTVPKPAPPPPPKVRKPGTIGPAMGIAKTDGEWFDPSYGGTTGIETNKIQAPCVHKTGVGSLANVSIGPRRITLIGAPPKYGKTDLVTQLVVDALRNAPGMMALIANAEMSPSALVARQIARLSGVPIERFTTENVPPEIEERVKVAKKTLGGIGQDSEADFTDDDWCHRSEGMYETAIQFCEPPFNTLNLAIGLTDMEFYCERRTDQLILVVDYIQLFSAPDRSKFDRWKRYCKRKQVSLPPPLVSDLGAIMSELRRIANTGVSVVVVSATNRESYEKPTLGAFRGGSDLEYAADDAFVLAKEGDEGLVRLCHVASRNSATTDHLLRFDGAIHKFTPV
jgi:replicative DNA helicase